MNWSDSPQRSDRLDRLAAEYALGTLAGGARRRFEALAQIDPRVASAAARWADLLQPLDLGQQALPAGDALWACIERRAFGDAEGEDPGPDPALDGPGAGSVPARPGLEPALAPAGWRRWLSAATVAALCLGLALGWGLSLLQQPSSPEARRGQLPESYVAMLATESGKPGLVLSSLRRGSTVDVQVLARVPVPAGKLLVLWTLDAAGVARAVAPLPALGRHFFSLDLGHPAEEAFARAEELAVSLEPAGALAALAVVPSGAYVYRGPCAKLGPAAAAPGPR